MSTQRGLGLRLLMLGAGYRLAGVAFVVAAIWAGFFWATSIPGSL